MYVNNHDGWKTCNFTYFLTAFQSYRDNGQVIISGIKRINKIDDK